MSFDIGEYLEANELTPGKRFARWYDTFTRAKRLDEIREHVLEAAKFLPADAAALDVATGPGHFAIELAKAGKFDVTGVDISADFVDVCKANAAREGIKVEFRQGDASALPFDDDAFDLIFCSSAFREFKDPVNALCEIHRALKPGGVAMIVDINRGAPNKALAKKAAQLSKSGFKRWIAKRVLGYIRNNAYSRSDLETMLKLVSFEKSEIKEDGIWVYVYLYK